MASRFIMIAAALAAPLLLAACEQEAQQQAETGQAEAPQTAETEPAAPAEPQPDEPPATGEPQPPAATQPGGPAAAPPASGAAEGEGEVVVVPPEEETPAGEQQTAQAPDERQAPERQPARAPGEPSPEAAGVASVAAYVGRWAEEEGMCQRAYWIFTNLRLQTPDGMACDIISTGEQEDGVSLEVACTDQDQPLAEPRRGTMSISFPDLPQTDTMAVGGGPVEGEERSLIRCPLG